MQKQWSSSPIIAYDNDDREEQAQDCIHDGEDQQEGGEELEPERHKEPDRHNQHQGNQDPEAEVDILSYFAPACTAALSECKGC